MNHIVQLTTQDVSRAIPVTTSLIVAEYFGKEHSRVLRDTRELMADIKDIGETAEMYYVLESTYKDTYGREYPSYEFNEPFWMMLVMGYTGKKATEIKMKFIAQFMKMKQELLARVNTRHIGKSIRLSMTDAIKNHVADGGNFKKFAYSNYTKLVYKRILGMDVKSAKELRKVPEDGNIRDFLTMDELEKVQALESKIAGFIEISDTDGKDDKEIYAMVKAYIAIQEPI